MERRVCGEEKGKTRPFSQKARRCTRLANRYKASHDLSILKHFAMASVRQASSLSSAV